VQLQGLAEPPGYWNPAPVALGNGTIRLMIKNGGPSSATVLEATSWQGPYRRVAPFDVVKCSVFRFKWCLEDPVMYRDPRGHWHALFHMFDNVSSTTPAWTGGHAHSRDGIIWSNVSQAFNTTVAVVGEAVVFAERRERPKLLFDAEGWPSHLYTGVRMPGRAGTYTLVQPIRRVGATLDGHTVL
jgi:hypothetical protein